MKVAICSSDNNASSGAFLSMANLAKQLNGLGVETVVILPKKSKCTGPGDGVKILDEYGVGYYLNKSVSWIVPVEYKTDFIRILVRWKNRINRLWNIPAIIRLYFFLKKGKFDILHLNSIYSYYGFYSAKLAKLPIIWHIREFLEEDQGMELCNKKQGYNLINRADRIVLISKCLYSKYAQLLDQNKLVTIYNGIDEKQFLNYNHKILEKDKIVFVYVGGISKGKGIVELIKACYILNKKGYTKDYSLLIAGRGTKEFQKYLELMIKKYKLENVNYLGYIKEINRLIEKGDVSIITSHAEAFGRTTVEAMLGGNLVIGANSAGTRELISNGKYGLLFECANAESLAYQMEYVFSHREMCRIKARHAQEYMAQNMTAKINAQNIYKLYKDVLNKNGERGV